MSLYKIAFSVIVGVALGIFFIFVQTENTLPQNPPASLVSQDCNPYSACGGCIGAIQLKPGVKKNGFPLTNKTVYSGVCVAVLDTTNKIRAATDLTVGLIIGIALTRGLFMFQNRIKSK